MALPETVTCPTSSSRLDIASYSCFTNPLDRKIANFTTVDLLQAKVSELEQKVAEQQRAMTVLLQDKANLESRVNIFVRVLQMRDEQIEQIRSGQRVCFHAQRECCLNALACQPCLEITVR